MSVYKMVNKMCTLGIIGFISVRDYSALYMYTIYKQRNKEKSAGTTYMRNISIWNKKQERGTDGIEKIHIKNFSFSLLYFKLRTRTGNR